MSLLGLEEISISTSTTVSVRPAQGLDEDWLLSDLKGKLSKNTEEPVIRMHDRPLSNLSITADEDYGKDEIEILPWMFLTRSCSSSRIHRWYMGAVLLKGDESRYRLILDEAGWWDCQGNGGRFPTLSLQTISWWKNCIPRLSQSVVPHESIRLDLFVVERMSASILRRWSKRAQKELIACFGSGYMECPGEIFFLPCCMLMGMEGYKYYKDTYPDMSNKELVECIVNEPSDL